MAWARGKGDRFQDRRRSGTTKSSLVYGGGHQPSPIRERGMNSFRQPEQELAASTGRSFMASLPVDKRLYKEDIRGSIAHARMLAKQGIIPEKDAELIVMGLTSIREEIEKGEFPFRPEHEDIHMNIEARLYEKIGAGAGELHTGRSRNHPAGPGMR